MPLTRVAEINEGRTIPEDSTGDSVQADASTGQPSQRGFKRRLLASLAALGAAVTLYVWYTGSHVDNRAVTIDRLENGPVTQIIAWNADNTAVQLAKVSDVPPDDLWRA